MITEKYYRTAMIVKRKANSATGTFSNDHPRQREHCSWCWWEWIPVRALAFVSKKSCWDWDLPKHTLLPLLMRKGAGRTRERELQSSSVFLQLHCAAPPRGKTTQLPVMKMPLKCQGCFDLLWTQKTSFHRLALLAYMLSESDCVRDADEGTMGGFRSTSDIAVTSSPVFLALGQQSSLNNRSATSVQVSKCVCVSHLTWIKVK